MVDIDCKINGRNTVAPQRLFRVAPGAMCGRQQEWPHQRGYIPHERDLLFIYCVLSLFHAHSKTLEGLEWPFLFRGSVRDLEGPYHLFWQAQTWQF